MTLAATFSITGPGGTNITCTGNSIIDSNGNIVNEDVTISLNEFNTLDEMIFAKAPTTSNGNLLVTCKDEVIIPKPKAFLSLKYPKPSYKKD